MERGKAVCGNMNMIVCDGSNYSCQFCSPYGVGDTSTIWFNRAARARVVDPCPNSCFAFLDMAATIRVGPGFLISNFKCDSRYGMMGNGVHFNQKRSMEALGSLHFSKFLEFSETRRCLSMPSITYGMVSNVVKVLIFFRNVTSKILQLCMIA